jgi:hypothetical protein
MAAAADYSVIAAGWRPAIILVDRAAVPTFICQSCGATYDDPNDESRCTGCAGITLRTESRVWGWIRVQRYSDQSDYGIDFFKRGRKVLRRDKSCFIWTTDGGDAELEYPIDSPGRGRIVGEIHCDHVPVNLVRTEFLHDSPAWRHVVKAIRGGGPLRPHAALQGFERSDSPLARIFDGYRREDPGLRCLVMGTAC